MTVLTFDTYKDGGKVSVNESGLVFSIPHSPSEGNLLEFSKELKGETRLIADLLPILVEQDLACETPDGFLVSNEHVAALYSEEYALIDLLPSYCPFVLQVRSRGNISDGSLKYEFGFFSGFQEVGCIVVGTFLKKAGDLFFMPPSMFRLISSLKSFNSLPVESKDKATALLAIAEIKKHSSECGSILDKYLNSEQVVVANSVGMNLIEDADGSLTMSPKVAGVEDEQLQKRFRQLKNVDGVYDLDAPDGARIRVVFPEPVREVVTRMKSVHRATGDKKRKVLSDPLSVFEGVEDIDKLDFSSFSPRVKGIGEPVFQPKPFIRRKSNSFLDDEGLEKQESSEFGIQFRTASGDSLKIDFSSDAEFAKFKNQAKDTFKSGNSGLSWTNLSGDTFQIPITSSFIEQLDEMEHDVVSSQAVDAEETNESKKYLLIYENEESIEYSENASSSEIGLKLTFERPDALITNFQGKSFELKEYQQEGVAWLQGLINSRHSNTKLSSRRGCLLADDMGLGKTLQILTFLAWCIETGLVDSLGGAKGPYKPILIVAPLILLQTWRNEIARFFKNDGAIFMPFLLLHGENIRKIKNASIGKEYEVGTPSLDLDALTNNRIVVTNYDTVKNYQHSFARIPWSLVICDEAQEIKEPKTSVTWALKSQNSMFRIAMTGTPVENRLLDLWNICDFIQPGLLGSAKEFSSRFESGAQEADQAQRQVLADELRRNLSHDKPNAYILRRRKIDKLEGLPSKHEFMRKSSLTAQQKQLHAQIISSLKSTNGKSGQHLKALQRLSKIYQHPAIDLEKVIDKPARHYIDGSEKLADTLSILHEIRSRREKVLVFALFTKMQLILKKVIEEEFGFPVNIVNGSVTTSGAGSGTSLRHKIIEAFESKPGFNVIILSPDVAGVGLTITGANNVIHYGRWWNPAKEAQATDRVYRLGQTRDVNVFYPISVADEFCSFDERLHSLLLAKRELANDFLMPTGSLDISESDLVSGLEQPSSRAKTSSAGVVSFAQLKDLSNDRLTSVIAAKFAENGLAVCLAPKEQGCGFEFAYVEKGQLNLAIIIKSSSDAQAAIELASKNKMNVSVDSSAKMKLVCFSPFEGFDKKTTDIAKSRDVQLYDHKATKQLIGSGVPFYPIFALEDGRLSTWKESIVNLEACIEKVVLGK